MIINLTDKLGEGIYRICYLHPEDDHKVVKVIKNGCYTDQNKIDLLVYSFIENKSIHSYHVPKFYGSCNTNMGEGIAFERVVSCQKTGASFSVYDAYKMKLIDMDVAKSMILDLFYFIIKYRLPVTDPNLDHYLYREINGQLYACIIDGLQFKNNTVWRRFKTFLRHHIGWINRFKAKHVRDKVLKELYQKA